MAEFLRENQTEHYINAWLSTGDPQTAGLAAAWLNEIDLTRHDFPYLEGLLQKAYASWSQEALPVFGLEEAIWFLADHAGKLAAKTTDGRQADLEAALRAAERTLALGEPGTMAGSGYELAAVPVKTRQHGEIFAVLICYTTSGAASLPLTVQAAKHFSSCFYQQLNQVFLSDLYNLRNQNEQEAARWTALLQIVKRIHDKIDVEAVLNEVFESMRDIYPGGQLELLMTQDFHSTDLRVKPLLLQEPKNDNKLCIRAYTDNMMLSREKVSENGSRTLEIAVPLGGKQGVYGVFHFLIPGELGKDMDLQLVGILADTAGNAFENAKLYEQSNLLIQELRLINELSRELSQSLEPAEVFEFANKELLEIFKADYCCISELTPEGEQFRIISTNIEGLDKDPFPANYGICGLVHSTREPLILSDYHTFNGVRSKIMDLTRARSLIAAPVMLRGEINGTILLAHRDPYYFSYENYKLLQVLATHVGLAIANASLYGAVQHMANRDMLTGLYARHYLNNCVQKRVADDPVGSLLVVDIDKFKQVNDSYGHQVGDRILKQVCDIIKSSIRGDDIAARWGGEELAIYFPYMHAEDCVKVAERIRERVEAETDPGVTVSCGIGGWCYETERISVEALFFTADMALYRAKNGGRNRTEVGRCDGTSEFVLS